LALPPPARRALRPVPKLEFKKHPSNPKIQLKMQSGFLELEVKVALQFH
jgi:hypothetical protein